MRDSLAPFYPVTAVTFISTARAPKAALTAPGSCLSPQNFEFGQPLPGMA